MPTPRWLIGVVLVAAIGAGWYWVYVGCHGTAVDARPEPGTPPLTVAHHIKICRNSSGQDLDAIVTERSTEKVSNYDV